MASSSIAAAKEVLSSSEQSHVLDGFAELPADEQSSLVSQLTDDFKFIDLKLMNDVFRTSMAALGNSATTQHTANLEPPSREEITFMDGSQASELTTVFEQKGAAMIAEGRAGVIILAGGAGTRLGTTFPKGMLVCPDLVSQKSLFQLHCEKVLLRQRLARSSRVDSAPNGAGLIQLCIMTSRQTDADTRAFFAQHNFFGLGRDQVHFFVQASLPCYSMDGKILKESGGRIATAPGGNGGIYSALADSGVLGKLKAIGVHAAQIFTVDNLIGNIADPSFYGLGVHYDADVCVKTTGKAYDHEAVGVFAKRDGKWGVVEYTEIGNDLAASRDEVSGRRRFDCANIAIHLCTIEFLERAADIMKSFTWYHAAVKPIPTSNGTKTQGVKLEAFIFDVFQFAKNFKIVQVERSEEFAPIKNAEDGGKKDTPKTAVQELHAQHAKWIGGLAPSTKVEISPLVAGNVRDVVESVSAAVRLAAASGGVDDKIVVVRDDGSVAAVCQTSKI